MRLLLFLLLVTAGFLVFRGAVRATVVYEFERGLRYRRGRFEGVVGPGLYWVVWPFTEIRKLDVRPVWAVVAGQEVLSADGVAVKASVAARYEVVDPVAATNRSESHRDALHLELQLALRQIVAGVPVEELLAARAEIGRKLAEIAGPKATELGLALLAAEVRDVTFPGELKKIFTQVVRARQEGLAALEKARGETAALRNLANAARLVERSPQLLQLRWLQAFGQQSGNTVVLGVPAGAPIPVSKPADAGGEPEPGTGDA